MVLLMFLYVEIALRLLDFCRQVTPRSPTNLPLWGECCGGCLLHSTAKSNALTLYLILSMKTRGKGSRERPNLLDLQLGFERCKQCLRGLEKQLPVGNRVRG